jgi:hypothetical protein
VPAAAPVTAKSWAARRISWRCSSSMYCRRAWRLRALAYLPTSRTRVQRKLTLAE